ncbi:MAG TPA: hypothetical protein VGC60_09645 [Pyrinomonadaceae bacterium]
MELMDYCGVHSREQVESHKGFQRIVDSWMNHDDKFRSSFQNLRNMVVHNRTPWEANLGDCFSFAVWSLWRKYEPTMDLSLSAPRPPANAEYLLYLLLPKEDQEVAIGDLVELYGSILKRFGKRRADFWFYKQVAGSLLPLLRRALLRIGSLVWLSRAVRRLIS